MKRMMSFFIAVALMLAFVGGPVAESALAATKKPCACKPGLRRKARRTTHVAKTQTGGANAAVVGPVLATYTLPANQYFRLRMNQTLNSDRSRVGDKFQSTVVTPVYASGVEVVPAGSIVEGRVTTVKPARTRGREGEIGVAFTSIVLPDGKRVPLEGALTELQDERSGRVDAENEVSGRSSEKRNIEYIGGGTAGGAILGGIIGGGKGAGIGAAIGAGAGIAGVMLQKGNAAELRSGTEIGMSTSRPIKFSVHSDR